MSFYSNLTSSIKWKIFSHCLSSLFILLSMIFNNLILIISIIFQYSIFFQLVKSIVARRNSQTHQDPRAQDNPSMVHIKYEDWRYAIRRLLGYFLLDQQLPPSFTSPFTVCIDTRLREFVSRTTVLLFIDHRWQLLHLWFNNYRPILLSTFIERIKCEG